MSKKIPENEAQKLVEKYDQDGIIILAFAGEDITACSHTKKPRLVNKFK